MKNQRNTWLIAPLVLGTILAPNSMLNAASATSHLLVQDLEDVSTEHPGAHTSRAMQSSLLHGDASGALRPTDSLTRQEMAVLLTEALQLPLGPSATSFSDVNPNGWSSRYVEAVRQAGIMQGDGNGNFRPTDGVTREELAVLLMRAAEIPLNAETTEMPTLEDWTSISAWAQPFVSTALQAGAMEETEHGFHPDAHVLRQEISAMILATFFPTDRPAFLQRMEEGEVWINGVAYQLSDHVKGLLQPSNRAVLQGAKIQFKAIDRTIQSISRLELHASGRAPADAATEFSGNLTLDGHGATLDGDLVLAGDYLSVNNLKVAHNFQITKELANDFSARHLQVQGKTLIEGGDENTVVFEESQLQSVDVSKPGVRIVMQGNSSVQQMTLSSNATIVNDATSSLQQIALNTGAQEVHLQGAVKELADDSTESVTVTGHAEIGKVIINSAAPVYLNLAGSTEDLQVNDTAAEVHVGNAFKVAHVSLSSGVPTSAVRGLAATSTPAPTVGATNTSPVLVMPIPDQSFTVGDANLQIDVSGHFTDAEQSNLKFGASSSNNTICKATITGSVIQLTALASGTVTITVLADDQAGLRTRTTFKVTVNAPPASGGIPDQTQTLGTGDVVLALNTLFTDSDNDPLTYEVTVADASIASFQLSGDQLTLTPTQVGNTAVTVRASDGRGGHLSQTFQLTVTAPLNQSPVVLQTPSNQTLTVGTSDYTLDLASVFQDPDLDTLTYEAVSSDPSRATVSVTGTQATVHALASGTTAILLKAKDGKGGEATVSFDVSVNEAPVIGTLPAITLQVGDAPTVLDLSSYLSDQENDTLTVSSTSADTSIATVSVTNQQLMLTPMSAGTTTVSVTVHDGHGGVTTASFALKVNAAPVDNNQAPEVISTIAEQVLTSGVTNARTFDLSQLFQDAEGDAMTFTSVADTPDIVNATVSGNMLTLTPGGSAGRATVTITANDGRGGTVTYNFSVRNAPTVANGAIEIRTKRGVQNVSYDLSTLFPSQTSFQVYEGTPDATLSGPTTWNGNVWSSAPTPSYVWLIGADGTAVVLHVTVQAQGEQELFFSEYMDGGDGRIALELYFKGDGDPSHKVEGYSLEVHQYLKNSNTMNVTNVPIMAVFPEMPHIFISNMFYDFFDITNASYFNDELSIFNPGQYNTVAFVLKKDGQVVDVLGDPSSHEQFLPTGGTLIRKQGIYTGSLSYELHGEWNMFPKGTYQFFGQHTL